MRLAASLTVLLLLATASATTRADPAPADEAPPAGPWQADGELGYIDNADGGSSTSSLHGRLHLEYEDERWSHEADLLALRTRSNAADGDNAEQYNASVRSRRSLSRLNYAFLQAEWTKDLPGPLAYQAFASAGLGRYLIREETMELSAELGAGLRHDQANPSPPADTTPTPSRNAGIANFNTDYQWDINPNVSLEESVDVQYGADSTVAHSVSELKQSLTRTLALSVNFDYRRTTAARVPALVNRVTTLNLIYAFE